MESYGQNIPSAALNHTTEAPYYLATNDNRTVIVVEDDASVLRSLRRLLASAGFSVRTFDRPSALLESEIPRIDACLLIDVHLPEMSGVELCEALTVSGCRLPVVLMTGHTDEATRAMTSRADAVAVLFKPFGRQPMLDAISRALAAGDRG